MRWVAPIVLFSGALATVWGQRLLNPRRAEDLRSIQSATAALERAAGRSLPCSVSPVRPMLNYSFRYQAGYQASVPARAVAAGRNLWRVRIRVTPQPGGQPVFFEQRMAFDRVPPRRSELRFQGGYFLGEGDYVVDWLLTDQQNRECRSRWRLEHRIKGEERELAKFVPPGTVTALRLPRWDGVLADDQRPYRVAILLHAAPLYPKAATLGNLDLSLLATTVISLLEQTRFRETSLTAFNLAQQTELYHARRLDANTFGAMMDKLEDLELGKVDVGVLSQPQAAVSLLASLVEREMRSATPPDAFIFIGPRSFDDGKLPKGLSELPGKGSRPLFFYLNHDWFHGRYPFADRIEKLVKACDGKVFRISHPRHLASAILQMEELLQRARVSRAGSDPAASARGRGWRPDSYSPKDLP